MGTFWALNDVILQMGYGNGWHLETIRECHWLYIVIQETIPSLVKISYYHMMPFCKSYLWKSNDLGMETKILIPRFRLQDFSTSVSRWPQVHVLHGSALTENEPNGKKILQQKSVVLIIQSVDGPFNTRRCIWLEGRKTSLKGLKWARRLLNVSRHFSSRLISIKLVNKSFCWHWTLQIVHGLACLVEKNF